ncbi:MAG: hypothetical protein K9J37_10535 [Saprospiraceae bacterium]|nr:hypothetical protein [Saprospiraceae bacterium]MCF8250341.1 hypothetical protein [Saprospiraceae bacterium]MCF8281523.1 hypothetical protein [Bacteroidales bacterium]MCF8312149.1 hypothetical protein [Saprospiraceae bacterium]MCF8442201.1 hypothetical protein [Saprospiraceae bacterium]
MKNLSNPKTNDFQQLQVLHGALMAGAVLVSIMLGFIMSGDGAVADFTGLTSGMLQIAIIVMTVEIALSFVLWRNSQSSIPTTDEQSEKWTHYRSSCIIRWACLEGGVLICVVLSFLEQNPAGFSIAAVGLAFLFLARPSKAYVAEQYGMEV